MNDQNWYKKLKQQIFGDGGVGTSTMLWRHGLYR
jgi:hypothetical protein